MDRSQVFLDLLGYTSNHEEAAAEKQEEYRHAQENAEPHERVGQAVLLVGWCGRWGDFAAMRQVEALAHNDIFCRARGWVVLSQRLARSRDSRVTDCTLQCCTYGILRYG